MGATKIGGAATVVGNLEAQADASVAGTASLQTASITNPSSTIGGNRILSTSDLGGHLPGGGSISDAFSIVYTQANNAYNAANQGGGSGSYQADIYANGILVLANATLDLLNTSTITIQTVANGNTQVNVSFNANVAAIAGPAYDQANTARNTANSAYAEANTANGVAQTASTTANSAYNQANAAYAAANSAKIQIQNNSVAVNSTHTLDFSTNTSNLVMVVTDDTANSRINVWIDILKGGSTSNDTTIISYQNTATTNQTTFVLSVNVSSDVLAIVTKNGLLQQPGTHYTISNNQLTFSSNCANNDLIEARIFETNGAMQISGVGGTNQDIQYNNNGILGGSPGFTYNPMSNLVYANGQVQATSFAAEYANTGSVSGNVSLDCNSSGMLDLTLTGNVNVTLQNCAVSGHVHTVLVLVRQTTGSNGVTWTNTIRWSDGTVPVLSTGANVADMFQFTTYNNGVIWLGAQVYANLPSMNIY